MLINWEQQPKGDGWDNAPDDALVWLAIRVTWCPRRRAPPPAVAEGWESAIAVRRLPAGDPAGER